MPRRTDAELGRIVRKAMKGMRIKPRRLFETTYLDDPLTGRRGRMRHDGYQESDDDFFDNNRFVAIALLEALAPKSRRKADEAEQG
jgi:hypothetical protein